MLAYQLVADVPKDLVQKQPADFLADVGRDAKRDCAAFRTIPERAVGDAVPGVKLDPGTDALSREPEARG